jgi:hypothetical protein
MRYVKRVSHVLESDISYQIQVQGRGQNRLEMMRMTSTVAVNMNRFSEDVCQTVLADNSCSGTDT